MKALRENIAEVLRELRSGAVVALAGREKAANEGIVRAEIDIAASRSKLDDLTLLEYWSPLGSAISHRIELNKNLIAAYKGQRVSMIRLRKLLHKAEEFIASGRFAESVPLLKEVRDCTHQSFPSQSLIDRIQRSAGPGAP